MYSKREQKDKIREKHLMPVNDCIKHIESTTCVCDPEFDGQNQWDLKEGKTHEVIIHHRCVWVERQ